MKDLGPEARAAVDAGRAGDEPTEHDRARIRAALMAAIAAGGAATVAAEGAAAAGAAKGTATAGALALGWGWKALVVGLAVAGAIGTGVVVTRSLPQPPAPPAPSEVTRPSGPAPTEPARAAVPADAPAPASKDPAVPVRTPAVESPHPPARAPQKDRPSAEPRRAEPDPPAPPSPDPLAGEMGALREAHGALQGGDPARALSLLDAQSATYASGQLHEEREAARVTALCKLGRKDEARAAAARFLSENPRSVLVDRVRNACPDGAPR